MLSAATFVVLLLLTAGLPAPQKATERVPVGTVPANAIRVRVVDELGKPLAGVELALRKAREKPGSIEIGGIEYEFSAEKEPEQALPRLSRGWARQAARTTADGMALLTGVESGTWRVAAGRPPEWAFHVSAVTGPGKETQLVLSRLPGERVLSGVVLKPDGAPFHGARVQFVWNDRGLKEEVRCWTDSDGRFVLLAGEPGVVGVLRAHLSSRKYRSTVIDPISAGTTNVEVRLRNPRELTLDVRDPQGRPLGNAYATLYTRIAGFMVYQDPGYRRQGLALGVPAVPFEIQIEAGPDYEPVRLGPFEPSEIGATLPVVLRPYPRVRGRVTKDGVPVEGAQVSLQKARPSAGWVPEWRRLGPDGGGSDVTDAAGRFDLTMRSIVAGSYTISTWRSDLGEGRLGPIEIDPKGIGKEFVVEVTRAPGTLAGRVSVPPGHRPEELLLIVEGHRGYMRLAPDGSFVLPDLLAGPTKLALVRRPDHLARFDLMTVLVPPQARWFEMSHGPSRAPAWLTGEPAFDVEVLSGETVTLDLDLAAPPVCRLAGRILVDGAPPLFRPFEHPGYKDPDARVALDRGNLFDYVSRSALAPDGSFSLRANEPDTYRLHLRVPVTATTGWTVTDSIPMDGERRWERDIASGSVRILPREDGADVLPVKGTLRWRGLDDLRISVARGERDPITRESFYPVVPAGRIQFVCDKPVAGTVVFEAEVVPSKTTTVRLE